MDRTKVNTSIIWNQTKEYIPTVSFVSILLIGVFSSAFPALFSPVKSFLLKCFSQIIKFLITTELLANPTLVLLGMTVPIFVLTVTLLGRASGISKEQQSLEEERNKKDYEAKIIELRKQIDANPDDVESLEDQVKVLITKKTYSENRVAEINKRYNALGLEDAVILPSTGLLISFLFQKALSYVSNDVVRGIFLTGIIAGLMYGLLKILRTLSVVQEVSLRVDQDKEKELSENITKAIEIGEKNKTPISKELKEAFATVLKEIDLQKEPHPVIDFREAPPFVLNKGVQKDILFEIRLLEPGGSYANNVEVTFILANQIEILADENYTIFSQRSSYEIPDAKTALFKYSRIKKLSHYSGILKLKSDTVGTFKFRYKIECEGYVELPKEIPVIVI